MATFIPASPPLSERLGQTTQPPFISLTDASRSVRDFTGFDYPGRREARGTVEQSWRANAPDVISETIDGETIILHLGNGFYFSAGGAGAQAWSLLSQAVPVQATAAVLSRYYETEGVDVEAAVADFVDQLNMEGLLVPADGAAVPDAAGAQTRAAWEPPSLSKFTDMEDLLLLDPVHEVSPAQGWPYAASNGGAA
jgi:hypothetical protein